MPTYLYADCTDEGLSEQILALGEKLQSLLDETRDIELERRQTSKAIGLEKKSGNDPASLIGRMQLLSESRTALLESIDLSIDEIIEQWDSTSKDLNKNSADSTTDSSAENDPKLPAHFCEPAKGASGNSADTSSTNTVKSIVDSMEAHSWDQFVATQPHATHYHQYAWRGVIEKHFAHKAHYLAALCKSGNIVGILPSVHLKSRLFGSFMVSMPYVNYGGPLSATEAIDEALLKALSSRAQSLDCDHAEIRESHPRKDWPQQAHKVSMVLQLPESSEQLDKQLGSKLRSQVRRAEREGMQVSFGGTELLSDFYAVFSRNMRDLGTPVYSRAFFADVLEGFADSSIIAVVRYQDRPVAAAFLLGFRDTLEVPWASSLRKMNRLGTNMFLYRALLDHAQQQGYAFFDFGRSTTDGPTYRFKKQWGAIAHPLYWHYWLPSEENMPSLNPDNPKYRLAIRVWKNLPVSLANRLGPPIVKNLP